MESIINRVKSKRNTLLNYISAGIDKGLNMMLVYLSGTYAFKRPNWFGEDSQTYDATKLKDKILEEFKNNPGKYGYGILLGKQPSGLYLVCIDIDIDNEYKDKALEDLKKIFEKYRIDYAVEQTKSGRYHVYVALDGLTETLKTTRKLKYKYLTDCIKYKGDKQLQGEIELLGASNPHMGTVYNGIISDEIPVSSDLMSTISMETFELALLEFQGITEETEDREFDMDMFVEFFKLVRKHNYTNGWDIDKIVSAVCVKNNMTNDEIHRIFEEIYNNEYDWKTTESLIVLTREKTPEILPALGSVIYHAKELAKDNQLDDDEKKFLSDFIASLKKHTNNSHNLPKYLLDAEKVYLIESMEKQSKDKLTYYREWWFIERKINQDKKVFYVEIETLYPEDIYKPHRLATRTKFVGIKIDIRRILKAGSSKVYEVIINDDNELIFIPSFDFDRLEDIAIEISKQCSDISGRFDIPLFQDYISIKLEEFRAKHGGKPTPCIISKTTGWNEDNTMFFHYDLNDDRHELSSDHTLYKHGKAKSSNKHELERQHKLVFDILNEGKLLGVLIAISAASILLKPLDLQPITCVIAGNPGTGKTTASLIATSLFYKSDNILINANTTKIGVELMLSSLNSLPFVVDEGALANAGIDLKQLIFSVASKKGRTRGRKDLSVDTKDILSNVFWTTETTDADEIRRSGAFRRMLYIVVEKWEQFTSLFDVEHEKPNKYYAGCGVDYIKSIMNTDAINRIEWAATPFGDSYSELSGIATTIYAGVRLLENFYEQFYKKNRLEFTALRTRVKALLNDAKRLFISSRDDVVFALQQYLYSNLHRFGQVDLDIDENGRYRMKDNGDPAYKVIYRPHTESLGEYDMFTKTFYITVEGFKTIAKELEKERSLLEEALYKAGVMTKGKNSQYSKILGRNMRFYEVKFIDLPSNPSEIEVKDS